MNFVVFYDNLMSIYIGSECTLHKGFFSDEDSVKRAINIVIDLLKTGYLTSNCYTSDEGRSEEKIRISYWTRGDILITEGDRNTWIYLNEEGYEGEKKDASEFIDKLNIILNRLCT